MPTTVPTSGQAGLHGADSDELERIARTLRTAADELERDARSVTTTLRAVAWVGGVATRFGSNWHGGHRPRIVSTAQSVREAAAHLERNAAEQRTASLATATRAASDAVGADPSNGDTLGPSSSSAGGAHPAIERLGDLLGTLGAGRAVLDALADHAHVLDRSGVHELLDILTHDDFASLLAGIDRVIEVGDVVVDLVSDFVEHPDLPFDERIVHALADAATRFGIDQGAEYAANFLAQAATTALLPGLGAALAPFAGQAAGAIADAVIDEIVAAVDGATDVIDLAADAAVDAYQALKETFGLVLDAAGAVVDVAGDAAELAGDAAAAITDAGGALVEAGLDTAVDLVGSFNPFDRPTEG